MQHHLFAADRSGLCSRCGHPARGHDGTLPLAAVDGHVRISPDAPETSRRAAERVSIRAGTQRAAVLVALFLSGEEGLTDDEIAAATKLGPNSHRPRRGELVEDGYIVESEKRRSSAQGQPMIVWQLTVDGIAVARRMI